MFRSVYCDDIKQSEYEITFPFKTYMICCSQCLQYRKENIPPVT